ncbi:MAG: hypothetical protein A2Y17_05045 [Clostridiales bacterium GWF2_38_85]|nr:MAG: hypothetical protein A2Y17_05045 [Clostridiales bacterium GWF2_38_85]HBL84346.1 RNA polymerase subunit sigma-24 [Clostridiales bacterium]
MKNYRDSDYAANKYAKGIVYRFADQTVEITLEDYLRDNPGKTEADFAELKSLSDEIYLYQDRQDNAQNKKLVSIHGLEETEFCATPSPHDIVIDMTEQATLEIRRRELAKQALDKLTEVQRRRYIMYVVDELTVREIADIEGSHFTAVHESIQAAEKKVKKYLANG